MQHRFDTVNGGLPAEVTVKAAAATIMHAIDYAKERDAWRARIEGLRLSYEKYGQTEAYALEERRLRTDLARFAIDKMAEVGDTASILALFRDYNASGHDYLGKVIEAIAVTYRAGE
jgi:hypothetical protein